MLRLLPDPLRVGLFTAESWIRTRSGETLGRLPPDTRPSKDGLLGLLDLLLREHKAKSKPGSDVEIVASDALFSIVALPWQDELVSTDELENYARLKLGESLSGVNVAARVHVLQRHFGATGLACATSNALLEETQQVVAKYGFRLSRFAPLSSVIHASCTDERIKTPLLALAVDGLRVTAHLYINRRLKAYEVESTTSDPKQFIKRLLSRTLQQAPSISIVQLWGASSHAINSQLAAQYFSHSEETTVFASIPRRQIL